MPIKTTVVFAALLIAGFLTNLFPAPARGEAPATQPLFGIETRPFPTVVPDTAPASAHVPAPAASNRDSFFPKGSYTLDFYSGYARGFVGHRENIAAITTGLNYYVVDNISLGVKFSGYGFDQPGRTAMGTGAGVLLRQNFFRHDPWTIFIDVGGGVFMGDREIPQGGTHFNFTQETGIGFTYRLHDNVYLMGGPRYFHLSNAHIKGPNRNPSINGLEVYLGVSFAL